MKEVLPIRNSNKALALWLITAIMLFVLGFAKNPEPAGKTPHRVANSAFQQPIIPSRLPGVLVRFTPLRKLEKIENSGIRCADIDSALHTVLGREPESVALHNREDGDRFHAIIVDAAIRYEVDTAMVKAIIQAESGYNPKAVSHRGAMGLMQLMPITAREMGIEDGFDPEQNIHAGVRYFKRLLVRYNDDVRLALAAYNAGMGKVREYRGVPPFRATRHYIKKVLTYHQYYAQAEASAKYPPVSTQ